jgi:eukaryotic-like serine/threonine-protein kinase
MDPQRWAAIESLFEEALEHDPGERSEWLERACSGDRGLFAEVQSLLACADATLTNPSVRPAMAELLDRLAADSQIGCDVNAAAAGSGGAPGGEAPALPARIGRYRILRLLGEGGMGIVYEAEQDHTRRTVALKVIKPGLGDPGLVRRFEQESLTLGRLQHPGIAQIYEAGTADNGFGLQPYFAMEFVRGQPLLEHAESHHLGTRDRLALMAMVCEAVHHAHQRGIIHRDLKPGNVLVDETGQPKILDFGVARATDTDTRLTRRTDLGQLVGTLAYMSPEQVHGDALELDTRSDVYALGVVLYEMLAHRLPYKISRRLAEAIRTIEQEEPATLSSVNNAYRGDVETIVGKALEKDKTRRYGSAAELADDIRRYLRDEPITARPASTMYQLRKFARRHKPLVYSVASVFVVLLAGILISAREAARAGSEAATSRAISDFLENDLLAQASVSNQAGPHNKPDPDLKVRTALDRAAAKIAGRFDKQPEVEAAVRSTIGQTYIDLGLYALARVQLDRAVDLQRRALGEGHAETLRTMNRIGYVAYLQGKYPEAEKILSGTLENQRRRLGPDHDDTLASMSTLGSVYWAEGKYPEAEALDDQALKIRQRVLGPESPGTLASMNNLATVYRAEGNYGAAEPLAARVLDLRHRVLGSSHPDTMQSMNLLANLYIDDGKYQQAEALYIQALEIRRELLGPDHPDTLESMTNLSIAYFAQGKFADAEALQGQTLEIKRRILGPDHPGTLAAMTSLGQSYMAQGRYAQAESLDSRLLQIDRRVLGAEHPDTLNAEDSLARIYTAERRFFEAEALYRRCLDVQHRTLGAEHPDTLGTLAGLSRLYQRWDKYALAETYAAQAMAGRRRTFGPDDGYTLGSAEDLALAYISQGKFAAAEPLARNAMEQNERQDPKDWDRFRAESLLGASLAGEKKYAEAEPLLLEGYQGMDAQKDHELMPNWYHLDRARGWLIGLYRAWGKPGKVHEWMNKSKTIRPASLLEMVPTKVAPFSVALPWCQARRNGARIKIARLTALPLLGGSTVGQHAASPDPSKQDGLQSRRHRLRECENREIPC